MNKINEKDRKVIVEIVQEAYGVKVEEYVVSDFRLLGNNDYLLLLRHNGDFYKNDVKGNANFRVYVRIDTKNRTIQEIAKMSPRPITIPLKSKEDLKRIVQKDIQYEEQFEEKIDWEEEVDLSKVKLSFWQGSGLFSAVYEGTILIVFKILVGKSERTFICTQKSLDIYSNYWMKEGVSFGNMYDSVENSSKINYEIGKSYQIILRHPYNQIVTSGQIKPGLYLTRQFMEVGKVTPFNKISNGDWKCIELDFAKSSNILDIANTNNVIVSAKHKETGLYMLPSLSSPKALLKYVFDEYDENRTGGDVLYYGYAEKGVDIYHFINAKKHKDLQMVGNSNSLKNYYLDGKDKPDFKNKSKLLPDAFAKDLKVIDEEYEKQLKNMKVKVKNYISDIKSKKINVKKIEEQLPEKENIEDNLVILAAELMKEAKTSELEIVNALKERKYLFKTK